MCANLQAQLDCPPSAQEQLATSLLVMQSNQQVLGFYMSGSLHAAHVPALFSYAGSSRLVG